MRSCLFFLASLLVFATSARADEFAFAFKDHGKPVKSLSKDELAKAAPPVDVKTFEFLESGERSYKVLPLAALLTKVYGDGWKKAEEILFTCADGYQPSVPVAKVKDFPGYLAFARNDQPEFTLVNRMEADKKVELGPYYLVWDNLTRPELKAEGANDQPYQVVAIDLIQFADHFPLLAPKKGAGEAATRGFLAFRRNCLSCHTINGDGGAKAALELNYPLNVTEYWQEKALKKWLDKPQSVRFGATMPPVNPENKDRLKLIDDVVAYLKAMAKNKVEPRPK
jgi:cytochrome c2